MERWTMPTPEIPTAGPKYITDEDAAAFLSISTKTLIRVWQAAPRDLPGAPIVVGTGTIRCRRRWDPSTIREWFAAAQRAREATKARSPEPKPRRRHAPRPASKGERLIDRVRGAK
jgi:hypothetical protein